MNRDSERTCRVCGCSTYNACPGGCFWVEWDLCSECIDKESDVKDMKKIAYLVSKRKLIVVEVEKGKFFDLTSLNSNVVRNVLLKISTDDRTKTALTSIQEELKKHVKVLFKKKNSFVGLIPYDFDFKSLERKFKTEVYYYH